MEERWESISFPGKASVLLTFVQTISFESLLQTLPSLWHNLMFQRIIRLNSDSRTVSDVLVMQQTILHTRLEVTLKDVALFSAVWYLQRKLACYCNVVILEGSLIQVPHLFLWNCWPGDPRPHNPQCFWADSLMIDVYCPWDVLRLGSDL